MTTDQSQMSSADAGTGISETLPLETMRDRELDLEGLPACERCGCTEVTPCVEGGIPCHWIHPGLCSSCVPGDVVDPATRTAQALERIALRLEGRGGLEDLERILSGDDHVDASPLAIGTLGTLGNGDLKVEVILTGIRRVQGVIAALLLVLVVLTFLHLAGPAAEPRGMAGSPLDCDVHHVGRVLFEERELEPSEQRECPGGRGGVGMGSIALDQILQLGHQRRAQFGPALSGLESKTARVHDLDAHRLESGSPGEALGEGSRVEVGVEPGDSEGITALVFLAQHRPEFEELFAGRDLTSAPTL